MQLIVTGLMAAMFIAPAFGQSDDSFRKAFDACIAALKAKNFEAVTGLMTAEARQAIKEQFPPSMHAEFFANALETMPTSYEVESVAISKDGKTALMLLVGMVPVPREVQQSQKLPAVQKQEISVEFAKEEGVWKIGPIQFGGDPDQRPRPKDLKMGARGDYSEQVNTQIGGVILRMEKQETGTVYVIRVVDEEDAVFVPAALVTSDFVTGAVISFRAAKSETDPLKYWAESAQLEK